MSQELTPQELIKFEKTIRGLERARIILILESQGVDPCIIEDIEAGQNER